MNSISAPRIADRGSRRSDVADRLAALEAELVAVRARVADLERLARVRVEDDHALMRALIGSVGAAVFSAADLVSHTAVDRELQAVLRRYPTVKSVGKRLRALADRPIVGFVLRRVTRDSHGTIWGLQMAPDLHARAGSRVDPGV